MGHPKGIARLAKKICHYDRIQAPANGQEYFVFFLKKIFPVDMINEFMQHLRKDTNKGDGTESGGTVYELILRGRGYFLSSADHPYI